MKAIVCTKYGSPDVLKLAEVKKPIPKDHEVLVKIYATTVSAGDIRVRSFDSPFMLWLPMRIVLGFRKPRKPILGVELSGQIEAVGSNVKRFKKGDQVYALTGMKFGGYAEYVSMSEGALMSLKPMNVTYEEAAAIPFGGTSALYFLRKGNIQAGQKVVVYGASGSVGSSAVQLAKHFGAEVTGVCSTANRDLVKSLGADYVIDYTTENFFNKSERYDIFFDAVGKLAKTKCEKALTQNGRYVTVDGQGIAKVRIEDLLYLTDLIESNTFKPVIDKRYSLEEVPEAHRYVEKGRKRGNVVINIY
ncbi:NAD(P)-dependent alcohol dehydrogenase [Paenibacillus hexagrammi]|uniref:NAD(P)-dependent alcohol dehydrogenase n=1 Tax=Paenibacillus hexagrammi TaxID=2908839 RepID=A0ABY3SKX4_9BACL|nr:NAD(P)-dependent alcohol dehydrogenase [Paenibacillus sp. YPD9-1]UJF34123.1 NAD(P)-dependent alcohol dehydrogenase [Paenibacillus sp. YPD9-1]